jgi:tricorn protease-like protein
MAINIEDFKREFQQADDKGKLALLENNLQLRMVVQLSDDETRVIHHSHPDLDLKFDYCQGNDFIVREVLDKLHIKHEQKSA